MMMVRSAVNIKQIKREWGYVIYYFIYVMTKEKIHG